MEHLANYILGRWKSMERLANQIPGRRASQILGRCALAQEPLHVKI